MMKDLVEIIETLGKECPRGNRKAMGGLLAYSIEQYEEDYGVLSESAYLMKYVRICMNNDVTKKGVDTVGYTQLVGFVKSWARKVNFN
ncbi:hypothetical protein WB896_004268 [Vibrio vulnificus]